MEVTLEGKVVGNTAVGNLGICEVEDYACMLFGLLIVLCGQERNSASWSVNGWVIMCLFLLMREMTSQLSCEGLKVAGRP